ncbi:protein VACUOLELESS GAMETOPHYTES [Beta vulgaris subsp. vulgaris]|uniref:protein VACUOLELESS GAMETOPHYTES n=1 Tax=Beta vulgaris subsp. vulgaris TaxID=3555 RepID=UPI0020369332|nr:protein VACUOLELESS GAMETOPHYTES [Beta vulgaris subsp. vulgaris]
MATLQHFTHLHHPLKKISEEKEFKCDGCERLGIGQRYQCQECSFNLHTHCGHCPADLTSFMHPKHRLHLALVQRARATFSNDHTCEVCGESVGGLFYQCKRCQIYVHPLCSQLPQYVHYVADVGHSLELQHQEQSSSCTVCGVQCNHWYYKCGMCPVVLHIDCLLSMLLPLRSTYRLPSSSQKKRSTAATWWWYCAASVLALQLIYLVMKF